MDLLSVILEPSNGDFHNDLFSNWVPQNDFARHLVISSNEPDKTIRETSLKVCSPFQTSLTPTLAGGRLTAYSFLILNLILIAFLKTELFKNSFFKQKPCLYQILASKKFFSNIMKLIQKFRRRSSQVSYMIQPISHPASVGFNNQVPAAYFLPINFKTIVRYTDKIYFRNTREK